jgi:hypothetical protein
MGTGTVGENSLLTPPPLDNVNEAWEYQGVGNKADGKDYTMTHRSIHIIADDIARDWKTLSPYARPYLDAMSSLDSIEDCYYADDARSVVLYFLSNAGSWRGDTARRIKAELKAML